MALAVDAPLARGVARVYTLAVLRLSRFVVSFTLLAELTLARSARADSDELSYPIATPDAPRRPLMHFSAAADSDSDELTLYVNKGVNSVLGPGGLVALSDYSALCSAPCDFDLRSATHPFAVTRAGGTIVKLDRELDVKRGQEVVVRYDNRLPWRVAGWVVLLTSVGAGAAMITAGQPLDGSPNMGLVISGSVLNVLGLVGGLWLANLPDHATGWVTAGPR